MEFLCHDINVHVPHHVNSKIPWYNLRAATDSLRQNWGEVSSYCRALHLSLNVSSNQRIGLAGNIECAIYEEHARSLMLL